MTNGVSWRPVSHTGAGEKGLGEKHLVTNGGAWFPISHTGAGEKGVNQKTGCSGNQSQNKGSLSIRFLLGEFCKKSSFP